MVRCSICKKVSSNNKRTYPERNIEISVRDSVENAPRTGINISNGLLDFLNPTGNVNHTALNNYDYDGSGSDFDYKEPFSSI